MDISKSIRAIREERRLTQQDVADILEMERSNYARLEARGNKLTLEQLEKIGEALGVSVFELLGQDEEVEKVLGRKEKLEEEINNVIESKLLLEAYLERSFSMFLKRMEIEKELGKGKLYTFSSQSEQWQSNFLGSPVFRSILTEHRTFLITIIGSCCTHPFQSDLVKEMYTYMNPYDYEEEILLERYRVKIDIDRERALLYRFRNK